MATIYTGPGNEPYVIHRNLVVTSPDFFAKALHVSFQEQNGIIEVPLYTFFLFETYMQWLYEGVSALPQFDGGKGETVPHGRFEPIYGLYELGTFIQDGCFSNVVIDGFIAHGCLSNVYPIHLPVTAREQLPMFSKLCNFPIDFYGYGRTAYCFKSEKAMTAPKGFWVEVGRTTAGLLHDRIGAWENRP